MLKYVIRRFFSMLVTLFFVITITFFLMHAVPGEPFTLSRDTPQTIRDNLNEKYGLDKPVTTQYVIYLKNLMKGQLGESMIYKGQTVNEKIKNGVGPSAIIGFGGVICGTIIGSVLGIVAALNRGKKLDAFVIVLAIIGVSVPSFVYGSLLQYFLGVKIQLLPVGGWGSLKYIIAPIIAATLANIAFYSRMLRTSMLDVMNQDYILTARSKGLSKNEVIRGHILRNSMLPLVTSFGPMIAGALTGSFVIEKIFNVPGIGAHLIGSIQSNDYYMIMGFTIFSSALVIFMLFIVDILYGIIDPRVRINR